MQLNSSEFKQYQQDGFLLRSNVFSSAEVARLRRSADAAEALALQRSSAGRQYFLDGKRFIDVSYLTLQFEPEKPNTLRVIEPVHELDEYLTELLADPRLMEPMKQLVGSNHLALWTTKLNLKPPHVGSGFGWHQDSPYWMHDADHVDQMPNVLLAIDDATQANGCFRVIRGSHLQGALPGCDDGTQLGGFYTDPRRFDLADDTPMELAAGSVVFFSPHSVHGSGVNHSAAARRALIFTYQPKGYAELKSGRVRNLN